MERDRAWRIFSKKQNAKKKLITIIEKAQYGWVDANGLDRDHFTWFNHLNTYYHKLALQNQSLNNYKKRWGLKGKRMTRKYYYWENPGTRDYDKRLYRTILKEHGII